MDFLIIMGIFILALLIIMAGISYYESKEINRLNLLLEKKIKEMEDDKKRLF